ncbi:hypothetical protein BGZ63DRAFT_386125 [Mariannaea sp. PMI_226]|nr:hypothetical protein BGZ63DRAFT_386125 [Mariannaea sp. PMI_226]
MPSDGFLFVNAGNSLPSGHKASDSASRSFVMRKARADRPWSTKTLKLADRRKRAQSSQPKETAGPASGRSVTGPPVAAAGSVARLDERMTRRNAGRWCLRNPSIKDVCEPYEGPLEGNIRNQCTGISNQYGLCSTCQRPRVPVPRLALAPSPDTRQSLDPFDSLAVILDSRSSGLLSYFSSVIAPRITPLGGTLQPTVVQSQWLVPSFAHSAFMHAILCLTAVQLSISQPGNLENVQLAIFHRARAISMVQRNLQDPALALSDDNIAAVFNILCVEENLLLPAFAPLSGTQLKGDMERRIVHMRGLRDMIGMRGGLRAMKKAQTLRSFLLRHSAVQAVASFETPYLLPKGTLAQLYNYPESSIFFPMSFPLSATCQMLALDRDLIGIVKGAECLNKDVTIWLTVPESCPCDILGVQDHFSILIDNCVRWLIEHESTATSIEGIICLCLLTYLACLCRSKQAVSSPLPVVLKQLNKHFAHPAAWNTLRSAHLDTWVAILGVLASEANDEFADTFFQFYLDTLTHHEPAIRTFDDFKGSLTNGVWKSDPMDRYAKEVWADTPAEWNGFRGGIRGLVRQRIKRTVSQVDSLSTVLLINPYTNAHPKAHATVEGSAYSL